MLLVKSKELKNSNKLAPSNLGLAGVSAVLLSTFSPLTWAQEKASTLGSTSNILSVFLSLLLVIAIIFALAFIMRRFNVAQAGQGQMHVVASMMAGQKEKIMVIQVGDEQHLLGVTAHNINHLAKLDEPLSTNSPSLVNSPDASKLNFQQKLVQAMANGIVGGNADTKNKKDKDNHNAK